MERGQGAIRRASLVFAAALLTISTGFVAAEDGLYGPKVNGNDAYLRILNALETNDSVDATVGGVRFGPVNLVSPYRPISPGIYVLTAAGHRVELVAQSREYLTAVIKADGISVENDTRHTDPARAQLVLYNYGLDRPVSLEAAGNGMEVIDQVSMGESRAIVVNAVPVELAVAAGENRIVTLKDLQLMRGQSYSVFVLPFGETSRVEWTAAEVALE